MVVAITGGTGFIGRHLARALLIARVSRELPDYKPEFQRELMDATGVPADRSKAAQMVQREEELGFSLDGKNYASEKLAPASGPATARSAASSALCVCLHYCAVWKATSAAPSATCSPTPNTSTMFV